MTEKLHCWPGCTAQVVRPLHHPIAALDPAFLSQFNVIVGRVFKLTVLTRADSGHLAWLYEGERVYIPGFDPKYGLVECIPDYALLPLTPPPGTEMDEETKHQDREHEIHS